MLQVGRGDQAAGEAKVPPLEGLGLRPTHPCQGGGKEANMLPSEAALART